MSHQISIAVIGAGKNSRNAHLPILKGLQDRNAFRLAIVCDLNEDLTEAVKAEFGFAECTSNAEVIFERDEVDLVYVIGTTDMHFEYAKRALLNGKHVFVEKPPAPHAEAALELTRLAKRENRVAVVGLNRRFDASVNAAKERVHKTGRIYSMVGSMSKAAIDRPLTIGQTSWIQSDGIHTIDTLVYLVGKPPSELHSASNSARGSVPQNASGLLVWSSGVHAAFSLNNSGGHRTERYEIHGSGVSYLCENGELTVRSRTEAEVVEFGNSLLSRGFQAEHEEFVAAIAGERSPRHSIEQGFIALRLMELIEEGYSGKIDWPSELSTPVEPAGTTGTGINRRATTPRENASVLVFNPTRMHGSLPTIAKRYAITSPDQLATLSDEGRESIVAAITGKGGRAIEDSVLDALPSLAVVGVLGGSVKQYNPEGMLARGIPIINTAEAYAEVVAEFTLMLAILGVRRASVSHDELRQGGWGGQMPGIRQRALPLLRDFGRGYLPSAAKVALRPAFQSLMSRWIPGGGRRGGGNTFRGVTFGIVGIGATARALIKYLRLFDCDVRVCSDFLRIEEAESLGVTKADMATVLRSKVVSLHRGLSERTHKSFGRVELNAMLPGSVLINIARGKLVDTEALLERLRRNDLFACLDVFEQEPLDRYDKLRSMPNVFLTSHIAAVSEEAYVEAAAALVTDMCDYLDDKPVTSMITHTDFLKNMT
jgi:phosphoglycerate dehydrogenase-like enzyme/predicted dehydrogenase